MKHSATRALVLLKAMNQRAVSTVHDLAGQTGISKPSIVRLLGILIEDGYVQRAGKAGSYTLTGEVLQLASGYSQDTSIVRAAGPVMDKLTTEIGWPTALGLFEQGTMRVRQSTISTSPLSWYRTTLHQKLPLLSSAMGLVYLAFSTVPARRALICFAPSDGIGPAELSEERFEQIRERGFAVRPPTPEHPTFSISVPLLDGDRVIAALSVTLFARSMAFREAVVRYLRPLRATAETIVNRGAYHRRNNAGNG